MEGARKKDLNGSEHGAALESLVAQRSQGRLFCSMWVDLALHQLRGHVKVELAASSFLFSSLFLKK